MKINAEQLLLNYPGYMFWKNQDSIFLGANHAFANILKLNHGFDIAGITDYELPCELNQSADHFIEQDKLVLKGNKVTTLNIHTYADNKRRILLTEKSCFYDQDKNVKGTIGHSIELTTGIMHSIANLLYQHDKKITSDPVSYGSYLVNHYAHGDLSVRESECLFFLIRGKTLKEIAAHLQLSQKTIETYVQRIKNKFNCQTKSQLIEKAINKGYSMFIPGSLLSR